MHLTPQLSSRTSRGRNQTTGGDSGLTRFLWETSVTMDVIVVTYCLNKMRSKWQTADFAPGAATWRSWPQTLPDIQLVLPPPGELDETYAKSLIWVCSLSYVETWCNPQNCTYIVLWHSGRTSVFGWRTFPVLCSNCSWQVSTYVGKPSAIGQPTRPTQRFNSSRSINE